jgi:hypothetical protein
MQVKRIVISLFFMLLLTSSFRPAGAASPAASASVDEAEVQFPDAITFRAQISNSAPVVSVTLEYGADQLTCGAVIAKAFPQFEPAEDVSVEWTWDMRQSGSLPPGETVWWRWRIVDANGQETLTEEKTVTWLDAEHDWETISDGGLRLHWYSGDQAFAQTLLNSAADGLELLQKDAGLSLDAPVDFYIYANTSDMKDAVLYEPSWTGGQAYPINDIVILGVSEQDLDWGKDSIVHELTHVLVGHLTFSCLGEVPTWLNEGLAVYSEGELDPFSQQQLEDAIANDTLLSLRSLSGGFSEIRDKATLSYSQSYSVVKYLIEAHGQEKMNSLLAALRDGATIDDALREIYGFNVEGLEAEWRQAIGARPTTVSAQPTALPTPTFVPTIIPIGGEAPAAVSTPMTIPTSSFSSPTEPAPTRSPDDGLPIVLTLVLLGLCCLILVILGGIAIGLVVHSRKKKKNGGSQ